MKKHYALLILLFIPFLIKAQTWQRKNVIAGAVCSDFTKLPSGKLILLSTDGIYESTDNGGSWQKSSSDMDADLSSFASDLEPDVLHLSNDTVYAYFRSNLYISTNQGINWSKINTGSITPSYETTFGIRNSKIYLTKYDFSTNLSTLYSSSNAGVTWNVVDTVSAHINLFSNNNEVYVWGYYGSLWGNKTPLLKRIDDNNKMININSAGLPNNADIRGLSIAGNNLVAMVPEYNQSSTIIATRLYGFNGTTWVFGTQFTENYARLYNANGFCFHPFFNSPYFLKSSDGINWTSTPINRMLSYYSSIHSVGNGKMMATSRTGIYELDTNFNRISKNSGLYSPTLNNLISFKQKIYTNSDGALFVSSDKAKSFTEVVVSNNRIGYNIQASTDKIYVYNSYLSPLDKMYKSADGVSWDTLEMPSGNFSSREVLCVSDNGIWMKFNENNVQSYRFYNDVANTWTDVTSSIPANVNYFSTHRSSNGKMVVVYNFFENGTNKTNVYELENNASTWKLLKHKMGNVWYGNTSLYNGDFYFLKNAFNNPDSLFKIQNDSLVFQKQIKYGNFKFYTDNFRTSFFYRGNDIYCLGFDSTQQNTIKMIRSIDGGLNWEVFNTGIGTGAEVNALLFDSSILASTSKGLYEFGSMGSFVNSTKIVSKVNAYPNPCSDIITISVDKQNDYQITLYDFSGKKIYTDIFSAKNKSINTSHLNNGIYLLTISGGGVLETKKIIIQH